RLARARALSVGGGDRRPWGRGYLLAGTRFRRPRGRRVRAHIGPFIYLVTPCKSMVRLANATLLPSDGGACEVIVNHKPGIRRSRPLVTAFRAGRHAASTGIIHGRS